MIEMMLKLTAAVAAKRGNSRCAVDSIFTTVSFNGINQLSPANRRAFSFNGLISAGSVSVEGAASTSVPAVTH